MSATTAYIPYCGAPPEPATLSGRWNIDPVLITVLIVFAVSYAIAIRMARRTCPDRPASWQISAFYSGWTITSLALISPLCALSVSLFAARVGQHVILILLGAPLVALGLSAFTPWPKERSESSHLEVIGFGRPLQAAAVFATLLWFWHAPVPYAMTFRSTFIYWTMHVTLYGSALWLWMNLLIYPGRTFMRVAAAALLSSMQMGFLGALITFASHALYTPHLFTTMAWGLTPLQDQQLGGAIMWIPGCIVFLALTMLAFWQDIKRIGKTWNSVKVAAR